MRPKAGQPRSGCAINAAVEVIGDRWSLLFQRDRMNRRRIDGRCAVPAAPHEPKEPSPARSDCRPVTGTR
ncbi:hypothetical protein EEB14_22295 [Rhodococcus sp. WS4]|nr:hypothetical protein EEB14_22295 [Rhodococcus sp. WS4]